jgi:hypothetical protein
MKMINDINKHIEHDADIYKKYTSMELFNVISSIRYSVKEAKITAQELGFISTIQNNIEKIIDCAQYYPEVELQLLTELGFDNPQAELAETINEVKSRKQGLLLTAREKYVLGQLNKAVDKLSNIQERLSETVKFPERKDTYRPGKRLFRVFSKIAPGAFMSISNALLAAGVLHLQGSPQPMSWESLQSVGLGVFSIITASQDLMNE